MSLVAEAYKVSDSVSQLLVWCGCPAVVYSCVTELNTYWTEMQWCVVHDVCTHTNVHTYIHTCSAYVHIGMHAYTHTRPKHPLPHLPRTHTPKHIQNEHPQLVHMQRACVCVSVGRVCLCRWCQSPLEVPAVTLIAEVIHWVSVGLSGGCCRITESFSVPACNRFPPCRWC